MYLVTEILSLVTKQFFDECLRELIIFYKKKKNFINYFLVIKSSQKKCNFQTINVSPPFLCLFLRQQ